MTILYGFGHERPWQEDFTELPLCSPPGMPPPLSYEEEPHVPIDSVTIPPKETEGYARSRTVPLSEPSRR